MKIKNYSPGSYKWKRNLGRVWKISTVTGLAATSISTYQGFSGSGSVTLLNVFNGVVDGFLIALLLSGYTLLLFEFYLKAVLHRWNFSAVVFLNTLVYTLLILVGRATGRYIMEYDSFILFPVANDVARVHFFQSLFVAVFVSFLFNFTFEINRLLGPQILLNFISGRYHQPRPEERVIVFLDLASSTTIAEELGDEKFLHFLNAFFDRLTEPILESKAEIYKYVGDEIILTWPVESATQENRCLLFFERLNAELKKSREFFQLHFGITPLYRAGMHLGRIITGELGDLKKEIAHVGDAMNTTARLAAHCRVAGEVLLLSRALLDRMSMPAGWQVRELGAIELRGKKEPLEVVALKGPAG
ncbi:MAG: adenylate/guanylate cyclase domain-containing protein [Spirochaetales bacterium]|nr:adenylate/guanylate cyclase domain-containing protein [Spirochaetales bacterium]